MQRSSLAAVVLGGATGIALWCILFALQVLPGITLDTWGVILFGAAGMLIAATRFSLLLDVTLIVGAAIVLLVTQTSISNALAKRWIRSDAIPDSLSAVVVLSESVNPNTTMSGGGLDHLLSGLDLIRQGRATTLVTTTVVRTFPGVEISSATDQARVITLLDGTHVNWLRTPPTISTRDEALKSAALLLPRGVRRIAVVTSPLHTRRACSAFEAVGFTVSCVPALERSPGGGGDAAPWPSDRLRVFGDWLYEVVGTAKYRAAGWLKNP